MGYHDQFEDADVLSTLSWMGMSEADRIMKTAALFLRREKDIRDEHRNWDGPTVSNVRPFVKSYYTPPRGRGKATIEMVLKAISYQRKIREQRKANRPYRARRARKARNTGYELESRKNAIAARHYTILGKDCDGKLEHRGHNCIALGVVLGIHLIVDQGDGYNSSPYQRIYMRDGATGRVKVVVLEPTVKRLRSVSDALLAIAPKSPMLSMFGGETLTLNFAAEAFEWRGKLHPWRNVRKVYQGKAQAHKTRTRPIKKPKTE